MKLRIKFSLLLASIAIVGVTTYSVCAMTLFYANSGRRGIDVFVEANTTAGVYPPTTDYGLSTSKYVQSVKIHLEEGSYNKSKSTTDGFISLSKTNNPLHTAYTSYKFYQ